MILKYIDENNKEVVKYHVIMLRKGLSSIEFQYASKTIVEVPNIDSFWIGEEITTVAKGNEGSK